MFLVDAMKETKGRSDKETKFALTPSLRLSISSSLRRRGFSFAEVMFAVIVLGIGFIMIAAVFPVAISQSKATKEETTIASVAVQGAQILTQAGQQWDAAAWTWYGTQGPQPQDQPDRASGTRPWPDQAFPHTAPIVQTPRGPYIKPNVEEAVLFRGHMKPISLRDNDPYVRKTAEMLRSSRINSADPRFAWIAFYRRDVTRYQDPNNPGVDRSWRTEPSSYAQVVIIGVQSQGEGHAVFNGNLAISASNPAADPESDMFQGYVGGIAKFTNLDPRPIRVQITKGLNDPVGKLTVTALDSADAPYYDGNLDPVYPKMVNGIAPGCFLVIGDDRIIGNANGRMNGRLYRIGEYLGPNASGQDQYNLSPDGDFDIDAGQDGILNTNDDIRSLGVADPDGRSNIAFATPSIGFIIGKPMTLRSDPEEGFSGGIMDISAYSTFIQVK